MDNLNTLTISSLYEAFPPKIALHLAKRLEIHHFKAWQLAEYCEIELNALTKQCLDRRIPDLDTRC